MKKLKKIDKRVWFALIGIIILIIVVGTLVIINKEKRKDSSKTPNTEESLNKMPDYYNIINYLKLSSLPDNYRGYFYQKESYQSGDISNQVKIYMAIRQLLRENNNKSETDKNIEFSQKEVEKAFYQLFGSKKKIKHESLTGTSCSYSNFKYDSSKKAYIQKPNDCADNANDTILSEIIDVKQDKKKIEVYEKMSYVELSYNLETKTLNYNIYKDLKKQEKVTTVTEYSIESCKDLLNTYKYTFLLNDNNYYLDSVELVK